MLADLDHESSLDPALSGSKGARLAIARRNGLPVLPGFVVTAPTSRDHMRLGAEALTERGSGGARLVVAGEPLPSTDWMIAAGERLGQDLVARSSTLLEGSGEWAGAFTSYVDLTPGDLPKAVVGCWASAFGVDALERQEAAGISPGSFDMAVLIQPALTPSWGGVAELGDDGTTVIHAVEGHPAPLLQGWVPGKTATGSTGAWEGELTEDLEPPTLDTLAELLDEARSILGVNRCEWALTDQVWILQLDTMRESVRAPAPHVAGAKEDWISIARTLVSAPGPLGSELVLPWAIGSGVPDAAPRRDAGGDDLAKASRLNAELAGEVWGVPPDRALETARKTLEGLLGSEQEDSLRRIAALRQPDPDMARELMGIVHGLRATAATVGAIDRPEMAWHLSVSQLGAALVGSGARRARVGSARWEPLLAAIVLTHGHRHRGAAAAPGLGAGLVHPVDETDRSPTARSVLYARQAAPVLSQLLWDATGVVTHGGSPAAHLFESARSLGVPAVTGVELEGTEDQVVAVDGFAGVVATLSVRG